MGKRHLRKADRVVEDLIGRIVSGDVVVGSLLPKESDLASEYGVNRSVIREANKLLEVHRLVRPVRRRGTEVLDPMQSISPEVLQAMLVPASGQIDRKILRDILEIRAVMEVQMTELAAERRSEVQLTQMERCLAGLGGVLGRQDEYETLAAELAIIVAKASQNRLFEMLVHWHRRIQSDLRDIFRTTRTANAAHLQGLRAVVDAIRRRDPGEASALVQAFHDWATPRLIEAAAPVDPFNTLGDKR